MSNYKTQNHDFNDQLRIITSVSFPSDSSVVNLEKQHPQSFEKNLNVGSYRGGGVHSISLKFSTTLIKGLVKTFYIPMLKFGISAHAQFTITC